MIRNGHKLAKRKSCLFFKSPLFITLISWHCTFIRVIQMCKFFIIQKGQNFQGRFWIKLQLIIKKSNFFFFNIYLCLKTCRVFVNSKKMLSDSFISFCYIYLNYASVPKMQNVSKIQLEVGAIVITNLAVSLSMQKIPSLFGPP